MYGYAENYRIRPGDGTPTGPLNLAVSESQSDIVGFCGDDSRFETEGWDLRVIAALGSPGFCWAMDGHDFPWPSTCFVTRTLVDELGWFVLPGLRRGYFDVVWVTLADLTGSARTLSDVMIRHDNSAGDPRSPNFLPERRVPPSDIENDRIVFEQWERGQAKSDAAKMRRVLYSR